MVYFLPTCTFFSAKSGVMLTLNQVGLGLVLSGSGTANLAALALNQGRDCESLLKPPLELLGCKHHICPVVGVAGVVCREQWRAAVQVHSVGSIHTRTQRVQRQAVHSRVREV